MRSGFGRALILDTYFGAATIRIQPYDQRAFVETLLFFIFEEQFPLSRAQHVNRIHRRRSVPQFRSIYCLS